MNSEPFWELIAADGEEINRAVLESIKTITQLRKVAIGGRISAEMFEICLQSDGRVILREALLRSCFSTEAAEVLKDQAEIHAEAYSYNQDLFQKIHQPMVMEVVADEVYRPVARNQGFRRAIVKTYDHRCALCGIRIVTAEGHTAVDAAHVVPWRSQTQNDDIRNGMALCKLCHWAFDEGTLGVGDRYTVITSRQIAQTPNVPGSLQTLSGRSIIAPTERELWPSQRYLHVHRREFRLI